MLPIPEFLTRCMRHATGAACIAALWGLYLPAAQAQAEADIANLGQRWLESNLLQVQGNTAGNGAGPALRMEVTVGALDSRLRLAPCAKVEPFVPQGVRLWGKSRLGLRCVDGATRWSVFLPVTVKAFGPAWVAKSNVNVGTVLTMDDAMESVVDWAEDVSPVAALPEQWIGQVAAHAWNAGQTIRQSMVKPPQVFQSGSMVRVLAQGSGFQVVTDGQAMTVGVVGQPVKVRMDGGKVMSGVVQDARTVRVDM